MMKIKTKITEDWAELELDGSLDVTSADMLVNDVKIILKSGIPEIKLNMEKVEYLSSAGIRALMMVQREVESGPGVIISILKASKFVSTVIKMAGIQSLFPEAEENNTVSTQEMICEIKHFPQWVDIKISGSLNVFSVKWLVEKVTAIIDQGGHHLRLDMSCISYISSAGIRSLIMIYKNISAHKGTFRITNPSPEVTSVLSLAGLDSLLIHE